MSDLAAGNGETHCNDFIPRFLNGLGDSVYNDIMPDKTNFPNPTADQLQQYWENENKAMINLNHIYENHNKQNPGFSVNVQESAADLANYYVNEGYLVFAAAKNGGHVAVVAPQDTAYFSIPSLPENGKGFEGTTGNSLHQGRKETMVTRDYPVFLQAGTYTGAIPPGWAFNRQMFQNGDVQFYVYKPVTEQRNNSSNSEKE